MGLCIGIDEAGIGPHLGPLVVAAVIWETPGDPRTFDFWAGFRPVVAKDPKVTTNRLVLNDSKIVFQPAKGLGLLERTALAAWSWGGDVPRSLSDLLAGREGRQLLTCSAEAPWHQDGSIPLPHDGAADDIHRISMRWRKRAESQGVALRGIVARIVHPPEFNALLERCDNKSDAVASVHLSVTRAAWQLVNGDDALVVCDKHGGRNFYAGFLSEVVDGEWVHTIEEGAESSVYRCSQTEFRFEPRGERYAPVALASMLAKYLRELHMVQFNAFWRALMPDLRPTQGYPEDSRRFLDDIAPVLPRVNVPQAVLWRAR